MNEDYLDVTKSVMISSPAGSGKTEKLARRYIALLRNGSDVERILAITFTDKAAAEMKERIVNILRDEDPGMFTRVRERMPRMRISTIHSFCLKLLKRFCLDFGIDPSLEVMDGFNADVLWSEAIYESLLEDGVSGERLFYEIIRDRGIKGWNKLYSILRELHGKRPNIELGIRNGGLDLGHSAENHLEKILTLYSRCLDRYRRKKIERHLLDYNDLELMAYEAISRNPEWQNVLFSFDEHTDHILVDEFQDTSTLQWKILDKLTEEWRSGLGFKRDSGMKPTVFLVGDDKQSIYSFRGANVGIFRNARKRLADWLGEEYHFMEVRENYRSLPAIVDFVNALFERLMPKGLYDDWRIEYAPFEAMRQGKGNVELIILQSEDAIRESRKMEATLIIKRIKELHGSYEVDEKNSGRKCNYGDMAILLRGRTHLAAFEDALRKENIPFVVVKGIGFYNAPEVEILKDLLFFLIDPADDYSLLNILRSPLFSLDYQSVLGFMKDGASSGSPCGFLYPALSSLGHDVQCPLPFQECLPGGGPAEKERLGDVVRSLGRWLDKSRSTHYSILLEEILAETGAWQFFHERQRYLNVKKFINLIEELESKGFTGLEIREKMIKASARSDEPKANVNAEGMDAVKLMTVHASKGLQFPMVFLPCLDEDNRAQGSPVVMDEDGERMVIAYEDDSELRKTFSLFQRDKEKRQEEEKRLFYVAATRAMDYLCMSGVSRKERLTGKLAYLSEAFGIDGGSQKGDSRLFSVVIVRAEDMKAPSHAFPGTPSSRGAPALPVERGMIFIEPVDKDYEPLSRWLDVTEEIETIRRKHGDDWVVLGRAFHRLFEGLSKGAISRDSLHGRIRAILLNETMSDRNLDAMERVIASDLQHIEETRYAGDIIFPQENSYAELPFILQRGSRIYSGRIDRVIIENDTAYIYDYKTYPVSEKEIPELKEKYSFQMQIYRDAVGRLFSLKTRAYLFFTHEAKLVEI